MPGVKGKSGGKRAGARRPSTTAEPATLRLNPQARQELRILILNQRALRNNPQLSQAQLLAEWIHEKWLEYDAMIQKLSEEGSEHV